jgi:hypothetical protein
VSRFDEVAVPLTAWERYRLCVICRVGIGEPCESVSGEVVGGRPDKERFQLLFPHKARKLRAGYVRGAEL